MKINLAKTDRVVIKDKEGKVIANIVPGQITLHKGQQNILEIHEKQPTKKRNPNLLRKRPTWT